MAKDDMLWKFKKQVDKSINSISSKSEELIESVKIKSEIHSIKSKINNLFIEIGKEVYNQYKSFENIDDSFSHYCKAILRLENKLNVLGDNDTSKDTIICKKCGNHLTPTSKFCHKCGRKV